ncbi:MAG: hypothetical protein AB7E77_07630 [Desulfobulbus sp.]
MAGCIPAGKQSEHFAAGLGEKGIRATTGISAGAGFQPVDTAMFLKMDHQRAAIIKEW